MHIPPLRENAAPTGGGGSQTFEKVASTRGLSTTRGVNDKGCTFPCDDNSAMLEDFINIKREANLFPSKMRIFGRARSFGGGKGRVIDAKVCCQPGEGGVGRASL